MRILIVNTSEQTGGAAVASNRLLDALNKQGVKAKMLVRDKETDKLTVVSLKKSWRTRWNFLWERLCIFVHLHFKKQNLFAIDIANSGTDITHLPEFKEADVVHLEWINQGMLSLKGIKKIFSSGKAVVWTMHDLWPASSICHYARDCRSYQTGCRNCPLLPNGGSKNDLSARVFRKKEQVYATTPIQFVTCSRWLGKQAKSSLLLNEHTVTTIPNPIDTHFFKPDDKFSARKALGLPTDRHIILFVAQKITDERKGISLFIEAINKLIEGENEAKERYCIAVLGGKSDVIPHRIGLKTYSLGYISDKEKIKQVYNAADVFVTPSLEDNLPNTIMEAMACGVPCIGFRIGGIPEMIDHRQNGYVAEPKDTEDMAKGIRWTLSEADYMHLSVAAVTKVQQAYSERNVAQQYINLYHEAMAQTNYRI